MTFTSGGSGVSKMSAAAARRRTALICSAPLHAEHGFIPKITYKKPECQCTLKASLKRCVFSSILKTWMSGSARMCSGIEFHATGPASGMRESTLS